MACSVCLNSRVVIRGALRCLLLESEKRAFETGVAAECASREIRPRLILLFQRGVWKAEGALDIGDGATCIRPKSMSISSVIAVSVLIACDMLPTSSARICSLPG